MEFLGNKNGRMKLGFLKDGKKTLPIRQFKIGPIMEVNGPMEDSIFTTRRWEKGI